MPKFKVKAHGIDEVLSRLGDEGAAKLIADLDKTVEKQALLTVNDAKENAPIRDGFLKRSIKLYGKPIKLERTIGSNRPYAQRQEYEHATNKGYFRKALWTRREPFRKAIQDEIKKLDQ
jgi:hypothetical protein